MSLNQSYMDRAMRSGDPRFADILGRLGYGTRDIRAHHAPAESDPSEDLLSLRAQYRRVFGKKAYHGWDAAKLRQMIAEGARD